MNEKTNIFIQVLRNNIVQITFAIMGVAGLALGTYITIRLSPVVESVSHLVDRVNAVEETLNSRTPIVERFIVVENQTMEIRNDIEEIKQSQIRMEQKFDAYIQR